MSMMFVEATTSLTHAFPHTHTLSTSPFSPLAPHLQPTTTLTTSPTCLTPTPPQAPTTPLHPPTPRGPFDSSHYETSRLWATAPDNTRVPISIVRRKDAPQPAPMLLDAYGAYEIPNDAYFQSNLLSLLDRGVSFGIAHVRGGGEMGRRWYEDGKFKKKTNTFTDLVREWMRVIE